MSLKSVGEISFGPDFNSALQVNENFTDASDKHLGELCALMARARRFANIEGQPNDNPYQYLDIELTDGRLSLKEKLSNGHPSSVVGRIITLAINDDENSHRQRLLDISLGVDITDHIPSFADVIDRGLSNNSPAQFKSFYLSDQLAAKTISLLSPIVTNLF